MRSASIERAEFTRQNAVRLAQARAARDAIAAGHAGDRTDLDIVDAGGGVVAGQEHPARHRRGDVDGARDRIDREFDSGGRGDVAERIAAGRAQRVLTVRQVDALKQSDGVAAAGAGRNLERVAFVAVEDERDLFAVRFVVSFDLDVEAAFVALLSLAEVQGAFVFGGLG